MSSNVEIKLRILRLERALLLVTTAITGEAQRVGTPEELQAAYLQLGMDLESMRDDLQKEENWLREA